MNSAMLMEAYEAGQVFRNPNKMSPIELLYMTVSDRTFDALTPEHFSYISTLNRKSMKEAGYKDFIQYLHDQVRLLINDKEGEEGEADY
nr:hypothetical protein 11 [Gammaproteobacteria bacterium]